MHHYMKSKRMKAKEPLETTNLCFRLTQNQRKAQSPTFGPPSLLVREPAPPGWAVHASWHTGEGARGAGSGDGDGGTGTGTKQQITHDSPPHNSQPVTLKLRLPPTLA